MNAVVELTPIVKTVELRRSVADAFRIFTNEIFKWWPSATHTRAKSAAGEKTVRITVEPRVGGRVFETLNTGEERDWGEVLAFEPGRRFAMSWQLGRERDKAGEVEVLFEAAGEAACRVTLTHAHWERLGEEAARLHGNYDSGWDLVFGKCFADYADKSH